MPPKDSDAQLNGKFQFAGPKKRGTPISADSNLSKLHVLVSCLPLWRREARSSGGSPSNELELRSVTDFACARPGRGRGTGADGLGWSLTSGT